MARKRLRELLGDPERARRIREGVALHHARLNFQWIYARLLPAAQRLHGYLVPYFDSPLVESTAKEIRTDLYTRMKTDKGVETLLQVLDYPLTLPLLREAGGAKTKPSDWLAENLAALIGMKLRTTKKVLMKPRVVHARKIRRTK